MSIKLKDIYFLFLMISAASLALAFVVEYVMGYAPCTLCVYQRFPFLIMIVVSIIGVAKTPWKKGLFYLIGAVACSIILAGYHTGIELNFFELSSFCKPLVAISNNLSVSDFKNMLYNNEMPMCNKPTLFMFSFSMAQWNLILNLGLFIILIAAIKRDNKNAKAIF